MPRQRPLLAGRQRHHMARELQRLELAVEHLREVMRERYR